MVQTFISLLRGINVSGQKKILMGELKALYESLEFDRVATYVQSGNVLFDCDLSDKSYIIQKIEKMIYGHYHFQVAVILRSNTDFARLVNTNPFLERKKIDRERLYVTFLASKPSEKDLNDLKIPAGSHDEFRVLGEEIYLHCPGGYGVTRLSNNYFENKLHLTATTRNWKTVMALNELVRDR